MARAVEESGVAAESGGERPVRRSGSSRTAHEVVLQWREIRYEVPVTYTKEDADGSKRKETASKTILHDQNGVMRPGDFLAIMVRRSAEQCVNWTRLIVPGASVAPCRAPLGRARRRCSTSWLASGRRRRASCWSTGARVAVLPPRVRLRAAGDGLLRVPDRARDAAVHRSSPPSRVHEPGG